MGIGYKCLNLLSTMTTTFPKLTKYFYLPQHNSAGRLKIRKMPVVIVGVDSSGRPWQTARSVPFFFFFISCDLKTQNIFAESRSPQTDQDARKVLLCSPSVARHIQQQSGVTWVTCGAMALTSDLHTPGSL